jgi:hypothetical protein
LPERDAKDPQIQDNADASVGCGDGIDVETFTLVKAVPLCPEVMYGFCKC